MKNIEFALLSMGYRQPDITIKDYRWCKPLGYTMIMADIAQKDVDTIRLSISQHMYMCPDKPALHCWRSIDVSIPIKQSVKECVESLSSLEQYTFSTGDCDPPVHRQFAFLDRKQCVEHQMSL